MTAPPPPVETRRIGRLTVHTLHAGVQRLDGGAMFGVVPKPLWERKAPADARNRVPLAMRCLLIEHDGGLVLVDAGLGNKEDAKFREIYGVDNAGAGGGTWLEDGLRTLGYTPADVRVLVNTHLHFDHAGGNTTRDPGGTLRLTFPNARYVVQRGEFDYATHANERTAASYLPHNFAPVAAADRFAFTEGEAEVVPGVRVIPTPGHTPHHQSVLVESAGEVACFLGDLVPTSAHLPLPWIMGYDVEPLVTLETKRGVLARAAAEGWLVVFEHDPQVGWGRVGHDGRQYVLAPADAGPDGPEDGRDGARG